MLTHYLSAFALTAYAVSLCDKTQYTAERNTYDVVILAVSRALAVIHSVGLCSTANLFCSSRQTNQFWRKF